MADHSEYTTVPPRWHHESHLAQRVPRLLFTRILTTLFVILLTSVKSSVAVCPSGCSCDDAALVVTCIDANLEVTPITLNPSIRRLVLRHNKIKSVEATMLFYGQLQYADLSHNQYVTINNRSFEAQNKLQELHLDYNKISVIHNETFVGLQSLSILSMRNNFLVELSSHLFHHLPNLEELDLGQNRISRVDRFAFAGLSHLRILYLDDNQLKTVPTPSLSLLSNLAEFRVGLNVFSLLSDDTFLGLGRLSVLDVSGAGLQNISDHSFRGLATLRTLKLSDNKLKNIPTRQLSVLGRLEELSIGQNEFISLPTRAFTGLSKLTTLEISGTPSLKVVEEGAFADNLNLATLILSSNKNLATIEEGALTGLPHLSHLSLRDNFFTTFEESLTAWSELRSLDVGENPLHCDCSLFWLRDLLAARSNQSSHHQALCATPASLKDRSIRSLSDDDLGCALRGTGQQTVIAVVAACSLFLLAALIFVVCRYSRRVQDALKGYRWNKRAISRKEHEYQKTFTDDDYIIRGVGGLNSHLHHPSQQHLKTVPTTEL